MSDTTPDLNSSSRRRKQGNSASEQNAAPSEVAILEAEIFRVLYPPDGRVPVEHLDRVPEIRSYISAIIALAAGKPVPMKSRQGTARNSEESQAITLRIVQLAETPKGDGSFRISVEVADDIGMIITPSDARHRYEVYQLKKSKDSPGGSVGQAGPGSVGNVSRDGKPAALRSAAEADARPKIGPVPSPAASARGPKAQSEKPHVVENKTPHSSKQVSPAAAVRAPEIPHSENQFILIERASGKEFWEIHEALQARGIECSQDDVISRHNSLFKNPQEKPATESEARQLQQPQAGSDPVSAPTPPIAFEISPEDLKWIRDLAEMEWSAEEISRELSQSGISLSPGQIKQILTSKKKKKKRKRKPKNISRVKLDPLIWEMCTKENLTPEEISAKLQEDGHSCEAGTIRTRLRAQGAIL